MKMNFKAYLVAVCVVCLLPVNRTTAQEQVLPFFDLKGNVAIQTTQLDALADTIARINHRADDIVWSRIVYRVIDLRDKQNNQLYFPIKPNEKYKSLFRVILDASVEGGLKAYDKIDFDIQPKYDNPIPQDSLKNRFVTCDWNTANNTPRISSLIEKDPLTNQNKVSSYYYEDYASKQMKFIIQEIIFFNKHYSRMFTKIIGIAPVYVYNETNVTNLNMTGINKSGESVWNFLQSSVTCWYLFDELRPFLAKQYMVPNGNDTERLTFDEFFSQKLYSSYLLGDSNMFNRMLLQAYNEPDQILKEQKRIETELLNVEQDIWEY